ncbi:N-acetylmuramoyl-L-alanine amidase [Azospirillum halopraeferens]|uniref:N-acetylmuramoyl-L-alanine amidase n=1 Tax=Azospirillum halopraeferens TaxID=34010 RepID=UPI000556AF6B|nr:N-acetylmuramoyl-L-alanine amidase [Azospirillum halopraeferens]
MPRFPARVVALVVIALLCVAMVPAAARTAAAAETSPKTATALLTPPETPPSVIDARIGIHPDKTRFVLELSEAVQFRVETLADPYRVVLDLPNLHWPGGAETVRGKGLVERYRYGSFGANTLRVVFDTSGPVRVSQAYLIPPREGHLTRLVIDMERVDRAAFDRLIARSGPAPAPAAGGADKTARVKEAVETGTARVETPPRAIAVAAPLPPPLPPARAPVPDKPMIVIDPGHGGVDPGAVGVGGVFEKDITLAVARELKKHLEASGRYRVKLTRDKDAFMRLRERVAFAREANADLFMSLHADSIGSNAIRGLSVYTLSDRASDREAEMLAAKENRADAIAGLDLTAENDLVASILIDLAQRDTKNQSKRFARMALDHLGKEVTLLPSKPHREAGFAVLTAPDVPSVLVEMGYLSSPQDANLLASRRHQEKLARAMTRSIDAYFKWLDSVR